MQPNYAGSIPPSKSLITVPPKPVIPEPIPTSSPVARNILNRSSWLGNGSTLGNLAGNLGSFGKTIGTKALGLANPALQLAGVGYTGYQLGDMLGMGTDAQELLAMTDLGLQDTQNIFNFGKPKSSKPITTATELSPAVPEAAQPTGVTAEMPKATATYSATPLKPVAKNPVYAGFTGQQGTSNITPNTDVMNWANRMAQMQLGMYNQDRQGADRLTNLAIYNNERARRGGTGEGLGTMDDFMRKYGSNSQPMTMNFGTPLSVQQIAAQDHAYNNRNNYDSGIKYGVGSTDWHSLSNTV